MRVCSPHLGVNPDSGAGGEVYERELLRALAADGVLIELILAAGKPHDAVPGWTVTSLPVPRIGRKLGSVLRFPPAIAQAFEREHFDLLRVHSLRYIGPLALWARRRYRLPVPIVSHHHHLDPSALNSIIERRVILASDRLVTDSEFSRRQLVEDLSIPPDRIDVIPAGIEEQYTPGPRVDRWGVGDRRAIFTLGTLDERKNVGVLVDAMREMPEDVVLIVGGRGPQEAALRGRAPEGRVMFAGFVAERDKLDLHRLADVYATSSLLEGFGLAPGEAMSCGKPVVAFAVGSLPEIIEDGVTGLLAPAGDAPGLAARLRTLLDDAALRVRLGAAGRARIDRRFRWPRAASAVRRVYERAIEGHARS